MTLGDPRGIGPEVMTEAVRRFRRERPEADVLLLGDSEGLATHPAGAATESVGDFDGTEPSAGVVSLAALRRGVTLAEAGEVAAIVTGPVHKPALRAAGAKVPGQTELFQEWTGAPTVGMLMHAESTRAGGPLRILLATTHLALRDVPRALTAELLIEQLRLLDQSLRERWKIDAPQITLCALNPHASDGGLFGDEEARVFRPALEIVRGEGMAVRGPLPADTAFLTMVTGDADAIVVPYHDVGMAVFKTLAFGQGVNVTLGLPFVRTSPDHGTAFDLVGTGGADPSSALEALRLAARLVTDGSAAA